MQNGNGRGKQERRLAGFACANAAALHSLAHSAKVLHVKRLLLCVVSALLSHTAPAAEPSGLFSKDAVWPVEIRIDAAGIEALKGTPREYVRGRIRQGTNNFVEAEVRLKGNFSFQPIDQKPSFSLKLSPAGQKEFGGHRRLLLNNSLQDPSYLRGKLASEMFLKAGLPTARINFARVMLNGKALGVYLLVEGTDETFLRRHVGSADGNLYEGADQDIDAPIEIDSSPRGTDRSDLQALVKTCLIEDLPTRWSKLDRVLDKRRFASFMAMEVLVGHKDGYCMDLNNYRLYADAAGKFVFIAHGLDFILDNPKLRQDRAWKGIVAKAFLQTPEGRQLFRQQVSELGPMFYGQPQLLSKRVEELWKVIGPAFSDADEKERVHGEVLHLQSLLRARAISFPKYLRSLPVD